MSAVDVLFSDLDGTLVHYPKEFNEYADIVSTNEQAGTVTIQYKFTGEQCECMPLISKTGGKSYISLRTNQLIQQLRNTEVVFVIITGARSSTYLGRRPFLPAADFEFFENGGRKLANGIVDPLWTDSFSEVVGPVSDRSAIVPDMPPPAQRAGTLWKLYNKLVEDGWAIDAREYTTNFRIDVNKTAGKTTADFERVVQTDVLPNGMASSFNLGKADIYPNGSGKANAARHILQLTGTAPEDAVALFDDDNDIELGALCGLSFLPGATSNSVHEALKSHPQWTLMNRRGFLGTEDALERVIQLRNVSLADKLVRLDHQKSNKS